MLQYQSYVTLYQVSPSPGEIFSGDGSVEEGAGVKVKGVGSPIDGRGREGNGLDYPMF